MYIPKGNILIEDERLSFSDVREMQANLSNDGFTGYVKFTLDTSCAYFLYDSGSICQSLEIDNDTNLITMQKEERMINRLRMADTLTCSTYVTSKNIVSVLSGLFAVQPLYVDYEARKRDLPRVLEKLQSGGYSGLISMSTVEGTYYLAINKGDIIRDRFCYYYGEILCGNDGVDRLLNFEFDGDSATVSVYVERAEEIENKKKIKEDELNKIKPFIVKSDGGFLRANDVVRVDNYIIREWDVDARASFSVEIETTDGSVYEYKCQGGSKFSDKAGLAPAMMKKMGLSEGDTIYIRPL